MKNKTPKTIADLNINWTFCKGEGNVPMEESEVFSSFRKLNPEICDLVIKEDRYGFRYENKNFVIHSNFNESLSSFFTYLNWLVWQSIEKDIKLDRFERISDSQYVIHSE